jgi:hypothetical protein
MESMGLTVDPWQSRLLHSVCDRLLVLTCRQAGKSRVAANLALQTALTTPDALVLLLSPSERQSGELFRKVEELYHRAGRPVAADKHTALQLHLANGSRIIALPDSEKTIRGYSGAALLVCDEASRIPDELYRTVRPMLGVSRGRLIALSTPFGRRGWFYEEWISSHRWERYKVTAVECPRLTQEFLNEERQAMGPRWYRQEYECSFEALAAGYFDLDLVMKSFSCDVQPLF